jgi:hypothetical protein
MVAGSVTIAPMGAPCLDLHVELPVTAIQSHSLGRPRTIAENRWLANLSGEVAHAVIVQGAVDSLGCRKEGTECPGTFSVSELHVGEHLLYTVILRDEAKRKVVENQWSVVLELGGSSHTIIAMTANAMEDDRRIWLETAMDESVSKAVRPMILEEAFLKWGSRRRAANRSD